MTEAQPSQSLQDKFSGPAWNNSTEYPSINSNEFTHDLQSFDHLFSKIEETIRSLEPMFRKPASALNDPNFKPHIASLQELSELEEKASILIWNLTTFVSCETCIDGTNTEAQRTLALLNQKRAQLKTAMTPARHFLISAPEEVLNAYLNHPHTTHEAFSLRRARELADTWLSDKEEALLSRMRTHAIDSFGELYNRISGTLRCQIKNEDGSVTEMGLARASGLLRDPSESRRRAAWHAIQNAWRPYETSVASILNGLAGWRIEECELRSHTRPVGFLDRPIHNAAIKRETLEAMFEAIRDAKTIGRRANRVMSHALGKTRLDPWDLLSDAPISNSHRETRLTFKDGLRLIREALGSVSPTLSDFVGMMEKNRWLEGRVLPNKRQGAYCTKFAKSNSPRVYMTYMGSVNDIRTLAHELGHAFHSWTTRDLPRILQRYPMTLAETASIFAETVLGDYLNTQNDPAMAFASSWQNVQSVSSYLINIPARFYFEKAFYERRLKSAYCTPEELCEMTEEAWRDWYGDTISQPDRLFWMTKLHFSISGVSFYNFPYSFGALFSLGIYARKDELGPDFMPMYTALLRDTGRMTAEDLAQKHLGEDISKPEFWKKSLSILERQVAHLESLLSKQYVKATKPIGQEAPQALS